MMFSSEGCGQAVLSGSKDTLQARNFHIQADHQLQISEGCADKKKKVPRIFGWGLRKFSTIVCEKIEAKGRTTYKKEDDKAKFDSSKPLKSSNDKRRSGRNVVMTTTWLAVLILYWYEVSEEILSDINRMESNSQQIEFDEKNLRRRIYDAFNVLESIGVIARDKKEVWWIGFPHTKSEYVQRLHKHRRELLSRIQKKMDFLQEIEDQYLDLRNLALRNQKSEKSANVANGVPLPFLLIKTSPMATLEIDISEDTRLVHFDFNGTPFTMHDDTSVLKAMRFQAEGRPQKVNQIILDGSHLVSPPLDKAA